MLGQWPREQQSGSNEDWRDGGGGRREGGGGRRRDMASPRFTVSGPRPPNRLIEPLLVVVLGCILPTSLPRWHVSAQGEVGVVGQSTVVVLCSSGHRDDGVKKIHTWRSRKLENFYLPFPRR